MREYLSMIKGKVSEGLSAKFVQILKKENKQADHLAKVASVECMVITNRYYPLSNTFLPLTK